ncbi:Ku protein [Streptomyces sp. NBC_01276]|uniref:Ku protein n=1 Tax=Streptomyces sp. NBC_01276 TaxID=2903808 RepID=UPI00352D1B15
MTPSRATATGDEYVLVEPKELYEIAPGRSRSVDIAGFVDLAEVDPIFFDKTYYLAPRGAEYGKVYALLEQALAKTGKAGIATFYSAGWRRSATTSSPASSRPSAKAGWVLSDAEDEHEGDVLVVDGMGWDETTPAAVRPPGSS